MLDDGSVETTYTYRKVDEARIKEAEVDKLIRLKELEIKQKELDRKAKSKTFKACLLYTSNAVSPVVSVEKKNGKTIISITDKTGTHTQEVLDGVNGTPGPKGEDGKTSYFHVKYSDDGGMTFTDNAGEKAGAYIGTYTAVSYTHLNRLKHFRRMV